MDDPLVADRTGRGVMVAVLDSGVNLDNPHVEPISEGIAIGPTGRPRADYVDTLGHGTAVVAAIQEKAPDAQILVIRVFHDTLSATLPTLLKAMEIARERGARLVNMSLGTTRQDHASMLEAAVRKLVRRRCVVVSPREHRGARWWPGSLAGVAGVLLDRQCSRDEIRLMRDAQNRPVLRASGYPRPIPGIPPERNLNGISFATANVTGVLARLLEGRPEIRTVEDAAIWISGGKTPE
jgi:hypothetical protein